MAIQLPSAPATVDEAMRQANDLAYGFEKHKDPAYWKQGVGYQGDPVYYWKRMLGWQAGGDDKARFGLYADPPSPWNGTATSPPVDPPLPDPPSAPPDENAAGVLAMLLARQDAMAAQLTVLSAQLSDIVRLLRVVNAPIYEGKVKIPYLGTGTVMLTPVGASVAMIGKSKP